MSINLLATSSEPQYDGKAEIIKLNMQRGLPWDKRYAPGTLDDVILPEHIMNSIKFAISKNKLKHMTLYSGSGTGKTTVARLIPKALGTQYIEYNASKLTTEALRDLESYNRQASIGPPRIVILDECDRARGDIWDILRGIIGSAVNVIYILTVNHVHKIPGPILSRCTPISFAHSDNAIKRPIFNRLVDIATKEVISEHGEKFSIIPLKSTDTDYPAGAIIDMRTIAAIAKFHYPDIRAMIGSLEQNYDENLGNIKGVPTLTNTSHLEHIWGLILEGKDITARLYFNEHISDYSTFFPQFCDYAQGVCGKQFRLAIGIIISEHEYRDAMGNVNRELNATRGLFGKIFNLLGIMPNE